MYRTLSILGYTTYQLVQDFFHQPYVVNVFVAVLLPFTWGQYPSERFYDGELRTAPSVVRLKMGREHESIMWDLLKTTILGDFFFGFNVWKYLFHYFSSNTHHGIQYFHGTESGLLALARPIANVLRDRPVARKRNISKSLVLYWAHLETLEVRVSWKRTPGIWNWPLVQGPGKLMVQEVYICSEHTRESSPNLSLVEKVIPARIRYIRYIHTKIYLDGW